VLAREARYENTKSRSLVGSMLSTTIEDSSRPQTW
jgi:hypothetical protein